ncbi:Radial spoke head 10 like protein B [Melipona quadrifasciata]|uniref:Radial spoke head 10 like protein B n=1 Tax=Melipona quadrifasciata TaxID=166423 RepID=A0A0N0BKX0_9HYME|nr:Radial spoke head 10 like protein B [Melipona quadrifasciata]
MNIMLKEFISRKCQKKVIFLESYGEEEEVEDIEEKKSEIEELAFEDILADKRRKYSAKEEFIYLLYNDILKYFVIEWDGNYLRKKPKKILEVDESRSSYCKEDIGKGEDYKNANELEENNNNSKEYNNDTSNSISSWKLTLPDEFANIRFINNNTYSGRISKKMMEGEGVYRWSNGAQYKGEFEQNFMHGKGLLEWNNVCWYEGDFMNGYRHGRGIMVDGENRYMYTGQWYIGQRHGKGYSRYRDNGSYDGDWIMNEMNGIGLRIYPSGSRYVGQWKNGVRDGIGTMVWSNGNLYRGEWKCGAMNGYFFVWNGFFNKTFTWPQEASYIGEIKLNSVGGAKYSGYWKDNKKHGYGIIIDPKNLEPSLVLSTSSGKYAITSEQNDISQTNASKKMIDSNWRYEERWTYNCLMFHIFRLRQIYNSYAKLFTNSAPKCNLAMSKLCLWQLWRDCGIHEKRFSLVEIDSYIAKNETTEIKDPHHPFEKIEIWQFLHALLESSLCYENQNLLPMYCVFELYQQIGYPPSVKDLLRATCNLKDSSTTVEAIKNFPDGFNFVTVGEKVSYLLKFDEIFVLPDCMINISRKNENNLYSRSNELLVFGQLGISKMTEIMTLICPGIKDASSGIIINMDYKLTFLEFYEIILEATKQLLSLKKKIVKLLHTKKIEEEVAS